MAQVVVVQNSASGTWKGRYTGCCTDILYPSLCTSCAHADVAQYNGDSWCMAWCCYSMCGPMCGPCFRASARAKLASSTGVQDTIGCCDMLFGSVFYLAQELGHIRANPQKVMS